MSEISWVRLTTNIFDDEKIKLIEAMPESDALLVIWIKLLCQAGKTNSHGYIFLSETIPYTDDMLATLFRRPVSVIRLALTTFQKMGMIEIDTEGFLSLPNWEKHQFVEGMNKIREQNRIRQAKHREQLRLNESNGVTSRDNNVTVTQQNKSNIENKNNITTTTTARAENEKPIFEVYESNVEMLTPMVSENLKAALNDYPEEWVRDAIKEAVSNNVRKWRYIEKILLTWKTEGRGNGKNKQQRQSIPGQKPAGAFDDLE